RPTPNRALLAPPSGSDGAGGPHVCARDPPHAWIRVVGLFGVAGREACRLPALVLRGPPAWLPVGGPRDSRSIPRAGLTPAATSPRDPRSKVDVSRVSWPRPRPPCIAFPGHVRPTFIDGGALMVRRPLVALALGLS